MSEMLEHTVSTSDGGTITYTLPKDRSPGHGMKTEQLLADIASAFDAANLLGDALESLETTASPQRARSTQATENMYRRAAEEFSMLSSSEADAELGAKPGAGRARTLRRENRAMGIERGNRIKFPAFQFMDDGKVHPTILSLLQRAANDGIGQNELTLWMFGPRASLKGERPVDKIEDLEDVMRSFSATFEAQW